MRILVLVKQVHDSAAATKIDETGRRVRSFETTPQRMNRYDECAVEEAVRLKERLPGVSVDVLTVGPAWHARTVKRAIGMGADDGIHLVTPEAGFVEPETLAAWIVGAVGGRGYDLILAGVMSEDGMNGLVGPRVAARLGWPCVTAVVALEANAGQDTVRVQAEREGGLRHLLEVDLPAVLTIQTGINRPRYPSLSHMLRAGKQGLETIDTASLAAPPPRRRVVRLAYPGRQREGIVLEGRTEAKVERLVTLLRERALVR